MEESIFDTSGKVLGGLSEQLNWLQYTSRCPLTNIKSVVLLALGKSVAHGNKLGRQGCEQMSSFLTAPAWEDMDTRTVMMFIESLLLSMGWDGNRAIGANRRNVLLEKPWTLPGQLLLRHSDARDSVYQERSRGSNYLNELEQAAELQQLQLEEDWNAEFELIPEGPVDL